MIKVKKSIVLPTALVGLFSCVGLVCVRSASIKKPIVPIDNKRSVEIVASTRQKYPLSQFSNLAARVAQLKTPSVGAVAGDPIIALETAQNASTQRGRLV